MVRSFGSVLSALLGRGPKGTEEVPRRESCLLCDAPLKGEETYEKYRVCPSCRFHYTISARERVKMLMDTKGFKEKFRTVSSLDPLTFSGKVPYRKRVFKDQKRTGMNEAALVSRGKIGGRPCVFVCLDFGFMGGSMGCVVGEKVALAFEYAVKRKRPLVMVVTSAGVRLQEGVLSLMQMAKTTIAANRLYQEGLPYVCVLASPTTGQAYASFVNLADVLVAEPGAILGFSPLRVLQQMTTAPLPQGAHTSEAHLTHGMVDMIANREVLRSLVVQLLSLLSPEAAEAKMKGPNKKGKAPRAQERKKDGSAPMEALRTAQMEERPSARVYITHLFPDFVELHGDRVSGDDPSVVCGLATLEGASVMVIGQTPRLASDQGQLAALMPEGFRKAQRVIHLAAKFRVPVVTLIDSPGPAMSLDAEEHGIGRAIASTMSDMAQLPVPTVAAIIGQGGRESAMALGLADRILMLENAVFLPISPDNAATLMYRDATRVEEAAQSLHLTAHDCLELGVIDAVVPEPEGGAHTSPEKAADLLRAALVRSLADLRKTSTSKLLKRRQQKFRSMGEYTSYFRMVLARELEAMRQSGEAVAKERKQRKGKKEQRAKVLQMTLPSDSASPTSPESTSTRAAKEP